MKNHFLWSMRYEYLLITESYLVARHEQYPVRGVTGYWVGDVPGKSGDWVPGVPR